MSPRRLLVDAAYAALSVAALAMLLANAATPRRALDEFVRKCELDVTQSHPSDPGMLSYRDSLTIKYYSPMLWCNVSWMLGSLLSSKWYMLHSYDRILNFVLFKVVSVRATLDADWEDLAIWTVAYCCFGTLYLVGGLARDHMESLRLSPAQSGVRWGFVALMTALIALALALGMLSFAFLRPLFSILCIETLTILFDVGQTLVKKTRKLLAFRNAVESMKCRFPDATKEDIIRFNDRCSICREVLISAKRLPCDHLFHRSCLRSWLVRHLSCPTCRITLDGADVGHWITASSSSSAITTSSPLDSSEHGSDLLFATAAATATDAT
ncbi:hypothetical protein EV174_003002 [Coemansia sp. RSA 2320]|nr:hypothetical protein EV174_003002 [Coemansia sp. RSA 2320]